MNFKLIDKYLFKQVAMATMVAILLFIIVWISPELLFKTIQRTLEGIYTPKMGFLIIVYELPKILGKALPVGLLLGTIFTFDKLSKDFEITVLRGIGLSFWRILKAPLVFSAIVAVFCFLIYDTFIPYTSAKLAIIKNDNDSSQFIYPLKDKNNQLKEIILVSNYDKKFMKDLVVMDFQNEQGKTGSMLKGILVSKEAKYSKNCWDLTGNIYYSIDTAGVFEKISAPSNIKILKDNDKAAHVQKLMQYALKRDMEINNIELMSYISLLKSEEMMDEYNFMLNKFIQRFVHSFICILFALIGCLLGFSRPREQRLIGFTIAIGIIFLYYITMPCFDMFAEKGLMSPYITAVMPAIGLIIAIYYIKKSKDL